MDNNDIWLEVCKFLPIRDIVSVLSACKKIRSISMSKGYYYNYIRNLTRICNNYYLNSDQPIYRPEIDDSLIDHDPHNIDINIVEASLEIVKTYFPNARRGDVVWRVGIPELIYDGNRFELFTYNDNYEICFPPSYVCPDEFPLTYWNQIPVVPFNPSLYIDQLVNNFHYTNDNSYASTYFIHNYVRYNVAIELNLLDIDLETLFTNSLYFIHNRHPMDLRITDIDLMTELVLEPSFN